MPPTAILVLVIRVLALPLILTLILAALLVLIPAALIHVAALLRVPLLLRPHLVTLLAPHVRAAELILPGLATVAPLVVPNDATILPHPLILTALIDSLPPARS